MRSMQGFNPYFDPYKEVEELYLRDARAGKIKETASYLG